jgi:hypothetical protein
MEKKIYTGWINVKDYGESDDVLFLSGIDEPFSEELDFMSGKNVTVSYWISDVEASVDAIKEQAISQILGAANVEFHARYSDITGYLWTDEKLNIGGHNLLNELKSSAGKYLVLEVDLACV